MQITRDIVLANAVKNAQNMRHPNLISEAGFDLDGKLESHYVPPEQFKIIRRDTSDDISSNSNNSIVDY
jgi:hypothetical protein